jgi:pteridine reductase
MDIALHVHRSVAEAEEVATSITALGRRAFTIEANLQCLDEVPTVVHRALATFGQLDVLVNNAGVYNTASFDKVTPELWESTFAINLRAVFFLCQAAAPALRAAGNGAIVNLASGGGLSARPGFPVSAPYAASKAGVVMLTRVLALELAPSVRVNAVAPGIIASKPRKMSSATREKFSAITPLGRVGDPMDVADAVAYLISDEARFITGQTLSVDGGLVMH